MPNSGIEILIVDDDENDRDILHAQLRARGFNVTCATSGEDALQKLRFSIFDCIISDNNMPHMSGMDLLTKIRQNTKAEYARMPFILRSGDVSEELRQQALGRGATSCLSKNERLERLYEVLVQACTDCV